VLSAKRRRTDTLSPQLMAQNSSSGLSYTRFRVVCFCFTCLCFSFSLTLLQRVRSCGTTRPDVAVRDHVQPVSANKRITACRGPRAEACAFLHPHNVTLCLRYDITTSQMLVTAFDFSNKDRRSNLQATVLTLNLTLLPMPHIVTLLQQVMTQLLDLGVVPIINENDAVSGKGGYQVRGSTIETANPFILKPISLLHYLRFLATHSATTTASHRWWRWRWGQTCACCSLMSTGCTTSRLAAMALGKLTCFIMIRDLLQVFIL
jgi:hypothetical protein